MSSKITGLEPKPPRVTAVSAVRPLAGTPGAGSDAPVPGDGVHLTGSARQMAQLEQALRALPAVDELRVAAVKQRLQDGSYEIDPQRVADKLLHLESELARAAPFSSNPLK